MSAMHQQPDGPAFDIVLLLHVGCVVVGLVTTATAAATASRLRRLLGSPLPLPETLRRYFRPGVNWAARALYGVPVFGFLLISSSGGAFSADDGRSHMEQQENAVEGTGRYPVDHRRQRRNGHSPSSSPPRGPRRQMKPGAVNIARMTGLRFAAFSLARSSGDA